MPTHSLIDMICNICMAAGGIGTLGTLLYMIVDAMNKAKRIDTVQTIQSRQLESLFEPDIRLVTWTSTNASGAQDEIVISNHGEDLRIIDIRDDSHSGLLNLEEMTGWFPYDFDKNEEIHVPITLPMKGLVGEKDIVIICSNKLGLTYLVDIHVVNSKPTINRPVKQ